MGLLNARASVRNDGQRQNMCGIVALAGRQEGEWISRMNGAIVHRGPDDQGIFRSQDQPVSLAMRRLSILDLEGGHQPSCPALGNGTPRVFLKTTGTLAGSADDGVASR